MKIALSRPAGEDRPFNAGALVSELGRSKKFKGILSSAVLCLVIATVAALSDFRNSAFFNPGGADPRFADESSKPRPQANVSSASPDRGGGNSWSLDYLVQANSSFIEAAKQKLIRLVVKVPPMPPAPEAVSGGAGAGPAAAPAPRRASAPPSLVDSVLSAMKRVPNQQRPAALSTQLPPVSRNFQSNGPPKPIVGVAVHSSPTPAARPASVPVAQQARPAARAVIGGNYQSTSYSGKAKAHVERNYSYSPAP